MTFAQRQNRLTTHFSESIPVVIRLTPVHGNAPAADMNTPRQDRDSIHHLLRPLPPISSTVVTICTT